MQEFYVFYQILDLEIASPSLCAPQAVQWQRMHLPSSRLRLILGSGRSSGKENGNPLQDSWLGNLMDRGAWGGYSP